MQFQMSDMAPATQSPGRPREFDIDDAVRDAMDVFWTRGYHATSLPDLLGGTGLSRGSLYKAFGDKRALFLRALDLYAEEGLEALGSTLQAPGSTRQAIRTALLRYVDLSAGDKGRRGCLVVATASEMTMHDPEIAARVQRMFRRIQDLLEATVARGMASGEFPTGHRPRDLARFLLCQVQGMRVVGKSGSNRSDMEMVVDIALRCLD